jgi:hypothetical protein
MARVVGPEAGDLLLRGSFAQGFEILDVDERGRSLGAPFRLPVALVS